jgi:hypothetical protein
MKRIAACCLLLLGLVFVSGCNEIDPPGQSGSFIRIYGTQHSDYGKAVVQVADGGFVIAGSQHSLDSTDEDIVLIRTDADGYLLWRKLYGGDGLDRAEDILLLDDGGYLLVGQTEVDGFADVFTLRTDANGDSLWWTSMGGTDADYGAAVVEDANGDFWIAGHTHSGEDSLLATNIYSNVYLAKVSAGGNVEWEKGLGGTNEDKGNSIAATADGGFVIAGYYYDDLLGYNTLVTKVNASGMVVWTYTGKFADLDETGTGILEMDNGEIICTGNSVSNSVSNMFVLRLAADGNFLALDNSHGGSDDDFAIGRHPVFASDGSIVFAGSTQSKGEGSNDFYLYSVEFSTLEKSSPEATYGGSNDDYATCVIPTSDGGFAILGYTKSFNLNDEYDIALLRTDAQGNLQIGD